MRYPGNYGFVPHTLSEDGDPIDVVVANTRPIVPGAVINVRPIGVLLGLQATANPIMLCAGYQEVAGLDVAFEAFRQIARAASALAPVIRAIAFRPRWSWPKKATWTIWCSNAWRNAPSRWPSCGA